MQCNNYSTSNQAQCAYVEGHSGGHLYPDHGEDLSDEIRLKHAQDVRDREINSLRADLQRVTAERDEALCDAVESGQAARRVWNEATWRKEAAVVESETEARTAEQIAAWLNEVAWNDDGFDDSADISEQTAAAIVEQIRAGAYRATKGGEHE